MDFVDGNALSNQMVVLSNEYRNESDLQMLARLELNVDTSDAETISREIVRLVNQSKSEEKMRILPGLKRSNSSFHCLSTCLLTEEIICAVWCKKCVMFFHNFVCMIMI